MAEKTLKTRIQLKNETAENWGKAINFTPKQGEMIVYNYDIPRLKIGDGNTNVNSLSFLDENFVFKTTTINSKPLSSNITLTKADLDLGNVGNFKAVSTVASQGLTSSEKSAARANIGAGTSSFSGNYDDLTNKPTIPSYGVATSSSNGLMSSSDKSKLDGIAAGANKYTHPTYTSKTSGLYKVTVDSLGHISAATAVTKSDITALGIPAQDTTYTNATTSKAGLMSSTDKAKLDNISANVLLKTGDTMSGNLSFKFSTISDCAGRINLSQDSTLNENCLSIRLMSNDLSTTTYSNLKLLKDYWYVSTPYLGQLALLPSKGAEKNYSQLAFYNSRKQVGVLLWGPEGTATTQDICQFAVRMHSFDGADFLSTYEQYYFPNVDKNLSSNKTYHVLTTKNTVTIAQGGTGATTAAQALSNLGISATASELNYCDGVTSNIQSQLNNKANSNHTHTNFTGTTNFEIIKVNRTIGSAAYSTTYSINSTSGIAFIGYSINNEEKNYISFREDSTSLKQPLTIASGGTGAKTAAQALINLGLTATATELNYCDGVTSNIQTQLNGKAAASHTHTGAQIKGFTSSRVLTSDSSGQIAVSSITTTELNYLDGVTSSIQTQLNGKAATSHTHSGYAPSSHTHTATQIVGLSPSRALISNSSGQVAVSAVTSTELGYLDGVTSSIQNQLNAKVGFTIVASVTDP